ncbi:photosynthetic complex putative assembly protein PuhB [Pseudohaliea sp.]|uniref:photosynthetic complex putative assembly protein PuhB n=1 Tax=Pseudohaliea sp. TaxID=2740289 RepID=UPI0032EC963D
MSHSHANNEYDHEPIRGLPEELPAGEEILCQVEPDGWSMARRTFHTVQVGVYFAILIAAHQAYHYSTGGSVAQGLSSLGWQLALAAAGLGILYGLGVLYARTTVYTLTNRRVVLRFGVALPMMINLPLDRIDAADLRPFGDGTGDIALRLAKGEWISYWALWPHARPWHLSPVIPSLRSVPGAEKVAETLIAAVAARSNDIAVARQHGRERAARDDRLAPAGALA